MHYHIYCKNKIVALSNICYSVVVNGTTGEGMLMTVKERKLVTEAWVKVVKETKQHLMIQVGGASLPDVVELVRTQCNYKKHYIRNYKT